MTSEHSVGSGRSLAVVVGPFFAEKAVAASRTEKVQEAAGQDDGHNFDDNDARTDAENVLRISVDGPHQFRSTSLLVDDHADQSGLFVSTDTFKIELVAFVRFLLNATRFGNDKGICAEVG